MVSINSTSEPYVGICSEKPPKHVSHKAHLYFLYKWSSDKVDPRVVPSLPKKEQNLRRPTGSKPEWLRIGRADSVNVNKTGDLLADLRLATVCAEAQCPNLSKCWAKGTATFMALGEVCTMGCAFCAVQRGKPLPADPTEPSRLAEAVARMDLKHVVVTMVTRDDIEDGGASHLVEIVKAVRAKKPDVSIELLISDLKGSEDALLQVLAVKPDIINHNLETIPRLYKTVRPQADYERSLELLARVKGYAPDVYSKSGIMVGLGESIEEVEALMCDLRSVDCDILTIGQYLKPPSRQLEIEEYVHPKTFLHYKKKALSMGFVHVASAPLVRSSYNAAEFFESRTGKPVEL